MNQNLYQEGDKNLRLISKEVRLDSLDSPYFKSLKSDLIDTLTEYEFGVAISAIQIGVPLRVFLINMKDSKHPHYYINPKIVWSSEKIVKNYESCLSIDYGKKFGEVERFSSIKLEYINESGEIVVEKFDGLKSRIIQHELDHLNGVLLTDVHDKSTIMNLEEYLQYLETKKTKSS